MLTLAVIVSMAALAWPLFTRSFENHRLRKAGDVLRTAWANARLEAMTSGQTHVFKFEYGAPDFIVALWETADSQTEATGGTTVITERRGALPEGTTFVAAEKVVDARTAMAEGGDGQTAPQIFFYPDGTTSTAQVLLGNANDRYLKLELRGLTGVPKVGDVMTKEESGQ